MTITILLYNHKNFKGKEMIKNFIKNITILSIIFMFSACSYKQNVQTNDIKLPNQNLNNYSKNFENLPIIINQNLYERHFRPWEQTKISIRKADALWGAVYSKRTVYGANYKKIPQKWFKNHLDNANFDEFSTKNLKAITIKNSNLRVFPTNQPIFYNPTKPGEGFPFDYNQNSGIKINTPIIISHFTKDKAWAYAESSFASGFISTNTIAIVDKNIIDTFKQSSFYISIKDNFPIYKLDQYKETIKLGTIFPKSIYGNFFVVNQDHNLNGYIQTVNIPNSSNVLAQNSLKFNKENINKIINELKDEPYGWGEALSYRDCSALTKDYFAAFGLFLGRNSASQAKQSKYYDLKNFTNEKKKEFIVKNSKPFLTLIYLKGHIMLYVGVSNENEPLVFHNKTKDKFGEESRNIIGKAIVSTLELGKELENFDEKNSIINRVEGITIFN